jgi:4-diphosphocytidyl-2-C-methyl-D-erythritol kinase
MILKKSIFDKYPLIKKIKEKLYQKNALYSSISGSGSAVFGIFEHLPELDEFKEYPHFLQSPKIQYV